MNRFFFPGWHFLGSFDDPDGVGSWLLNHHGEALLLEIPPGMTVKIVQDGLASIGATLRYVTASHTHEDHLDTEGWNALIDAFPDAEFICPSEFKGDREIKLAGESLWIVKAPKHSPDDIVTVFRGVAMTGDIELGTLDSVNREVPRKVKASSMAYLQGFENRTGYHISTIVSAHLNDLRHGVDWPSLFAI